MQVSGMATILFAGVSRKDPKKWKDTPGFRSKALIPVAGRAMMLWVVDAIVAAGLRLDGVIGEWISDLSWARGEYCFIPGTGSLGGNLWKAISQLGDNFTNYLLVSCDIPAIQNGLKDFILEAWDSRGLAVAVIDARKCQKVFAGAKPTVLWVRGVPYTLCNAIFVRRAILEANRDFIELLIGKKKSKRKLILLIAKRRPWIAFKALTSTIHRGKFLTFQELTEAFQAIMTDVPEIRIIVSSDPGFGFDGDDPEKCEILDQIIRHRQQLAGTAIPEASPLGVLG